MTAVPKLRKRLIDKDFLVWLTTKPCLYCGEPANEPHHIRPDDYRAINICDKCGRAVHGKDKKRIKWMIRKVGREDIYLAMLDNLIEWIALGGIV